MNLEIVPITQKEANAFVKKHHRHHKPVVGSIFQIACSAVYDACAVASRLEIKLYEIVGVAVIGRPVSKELDNSWTLEVNRCCTDGSKNACSMLYSAAWRIAKNMGYLGLITYILNTEPGTSLRAAGWKCLGEAGGGSWSCPSRPRKDSHPIIRKLLFAIGEAEGRKRERRPKVIIESIYSTNQLF